MAVAKKAQSRTNNAKINAVKKQKVKWWVWVIAACGLLFLVFVVWYYASGFLWFDQQKMENYLESKYGQSFVVSRPEQKQHVIGIDGYRTAKAYPSEDPSAKFTVTTSSTTTTDDYPLALWSEQETSRLQLLTKQSLGAYYKNILVNITERTSRDNRINITGDVPSFSESVGKYGDRLIYKIEINGNGFEGSIKQHEPDIAIALLTIKQNLQIDGISSFEFVFFVPGGTIDQNNSLRYGVSLAGDELKAINDASAMSMQFKEWWVNL